MRYINVVTLVFASSISLVYGQNWVEERTYFSGASTTPRIDGLITHPLKNSLGTFVWFQVQQGYSQAYTGVTYSPKPWVQVALGGGLEQDVHPGRVGSYVWLGKKRFSTLAIFEDGGSGFWHKTETNYQLTKQLGVGTLTERYRGGGLKLEYQIPKTPIKIWFSPLILHGKIHPLFAIRWAL